MTNTTFQAKQLETIRADRRAAVAKFKATGATAEIGVVSNYPGTFTVNVMEGPRKRNFENVPFDSKLAAVKAFAREKFGRGTLKRTDRGTFLVFSA